MDMEPPLPVMIAERAEAHPNQTLIEVAGTDVVRSYGEFNETVMRWAASLTALGVHEGDFVATMMPNCLESYECWLGLSWLRAIEVPINPLFVGNTLAYPLNNAQVETLIVAEEFLERLQPLADLVPKLRTIVVLGSGRSSTDLPWRVIRSDEFFAEAAPEPALRTPRYHDPLAVIYTSGTTGPSKGVLQPWVNLHGMAQGIFPDAVPGAESEGATFSCWQTFHSSGKFGMAIAPIFGLRMVFRPKFSAEEFWSDIRRHHVTHAPLLVVGATLMQQAPRPDDADNPLRRVGMYPLIPQFREFEKRFDVKISAGYGTTEAGWCVTTTDPISPHSNGKVVPGYTVKIANEAGEELPSGEVGEILVRHTLPWRLNKGYLSMPEATAEAWRDGWFHTGDAGRFDEDGNLSFVDRIKDSLRRRGHNISSFEVESEVLEHPAVAECACVGVPSALAHAEDSVKDDDVKVFVVLVPGATLTESELVEYLIQKTAKFMVPRYVEFIDELPKTPTGKVRKVELRASTNESAFDREAQLLSDAAELKTDRL